MNARVQAADGCPADAMNKLAAFLGLARRYVSAAEDELRSLAADPRVHLGARDVGHHEVAEHRVEVRRGEARERVLTARVRRSSAGVSSRNA